ncbi:MAG TPA: hemolysin family protein [Stellaceae bacterium]|jgi:putative hemolysin|nr:hemolysin family protein [Stellaceae bacterium]
MLTVQLTVVLLLILLNGFFAMAEIALISARTARLKALAETGNPGALAALELKSDPSRLLATVQIGITVIAVLSGTFGQATLGARMQALIEPYPGFVGHYAHAISMAIVVIGISYLSLIIGELVPKRIAMSHAERIAATFARAMRALSRIGAPVEWFLSASTNLVLRLLPLRSEAPPPVTDEEIGFMLREGAAAGHIPQAETEIVEMALRLGDRRASTVMTPRTRIEWLDLDDPEEENRHKIRDSRYSRFPVVQGGSQQVVGIVEAKHLLARCLAGQPLDLRAATRSPLYLPNTVSALRVLDMFKRSGEPMALIVDEYGDLEGLVTPSDILEALVGDIPGAGDTDQRVVRREDGTWLIDGMVGLDELKQVLGLSHLTGEDTDFHTLGGYLMARLNRVPMIADRVTADGYRFEVVDMDGRRVDRVMVSPVAGTGRR